MRPWRLLIEVGEKQDNDPVASLPLAVSSVDQDRAWATLKDARAKMLAAQTRGDSAAVAQINGWIGGGLALMADLTGENVTTLLERLNAEAPLASPLATPTPRGATLTPNLVIENKESQPAPASNAMFYSVNRERPAPPPGAQKTLNPEDLTPEERAEFGMVLPGEEVPAPLSKVLPAAVKRPAKKKPAAKKPAGKKASS